ncbi:hypothetical protein AB0M95_37985, partial [Sphaerisporangium sp. NPDC051017]|uniref:restriction endonuclease-related protein n=1 Tax=Sphaerisporangium sp. NPDC051017 TaxID=3154636 RepID=UPI003449A94E
TPARRVRDKTELRPGPAQLRERPPAQLRDRSQCRYPFDSWPVPLRLSACDMGETLLEADELSVFAEEAAGFATKDDVEAELVQNQIFSKLMTTAQMNGRCEEEIQQNYVKLRRFLIDHPVVSDREQRAFLRSFPKAAPNGEPYVTAFTRAAYLYIRNPGETRVFCCAICRNPAEAEDQPCATLGCAGSSKILTFRTLDGYYIQHRATRRFFHDPGLVEARIIDRLAELDSKLVRVRPWPALDAWDFAVEFPGTEDGASSSVTRECWAADAKDCSSPALLARTFKCDPRVRATRRYIVLPMHRVRQVGYVADLERELDGRVAGVRVVDEEGFVARVAARALGEAR